MSITKHLHLQGFFDRHPDNTELQALRILLAGMNQGTGSADSLEKTISIYYQALPLIEEIIFSSGMDAHLVSHYQHVFRELEQLINIRGKDDRHSFIIAIPVADRPQHLNDCLKSLYTLCQLYQYGGYNNEKYSKLYVIVADDSKLAENISQNKHICDELTRLGIDTEYFGVNEQIQQLKSIQNNQQNDLHRILGEYASKQDPDNFYHKGASITRNITCLRIHHLLQQRGTENHIIHFIDSDQQFAIHSPSGNRYDALYAINYFHHMDEIFSSGCVEIMTGKVVGDPPVSPAVMASNFLDDTIHFMQQMAATQPTYDCCFHGDTTHVTGDAAYHDMASLFGFDQPGETFDYQCSIQSQHDNAACFCDFASRLHSFFDGVHPTRFTLFHHDSPLSHTTPARTVYTGNYAFKPGQLKYFISFAHLKLRMAGPVLGRLVKSEIHSAFVSANLPMLHKRTMDKTGHSEFRPDIKRSHDNIDFSGEFERQYYGDIMLFSVEKLVGLGYPATPVSAAAVKQIVLDTQSEIHHLYERKREQITRKLAALETILASESSWWHRTALIEAAVAEIRCFIENINRNYGASSKVCEHINSAASRHQQLSDLQDAILAYADDRSAWEKLLQ